MQTALPFTPHYILDYDEANSYSDICIARGRLVFFYHYEMLLLCWRIDEKSFVYKRVI